MKPVLCLVLLGAAVFVSGCDHSNVTTSASAGESTNSPAVKTNQPVSGKVIKTDAEWQKELTPEQYAVLRQKATERAFTGKFWNTKDQGVYCCAGCGTELFVSDTKYDSSCGWPSFYAPAGTNAISEAIDNSLFMARTEVLCTKCGGHLGHVFDDGPPPTGLRYCINSLSLKFVPKKETPAKPDKK